MEIQEHLQNLCDELKQQKNYIAGNPLVDSPFYPGRLTWLVSLMALLGIWAYETGSMVNEEQKGWINEFIWKHLRGLSYWGDASASQIMTIAWYIKINGTPQIYDRILDNMIRLVLKNNTDSTLHGLPDPYHSLQEVVSNINTISDTLKHESFFGRSYTLKWIIELMTRREWRGIIAELWPEITRTSFAQFRPDSASDYCRWHNENGNLIVQFPKMPQSWKELYEGAFDIDDEYIPKVFKKNPILLLLFINVYPHRMTNDIMKFLDDWISNLEGKIK